MKLTKLELELMEVLWTTGQVSVREIQERLPVKKRPAYTTVQTIIYRLEEKGAVCRVKKIGNAHVFEAAVTRRTVQRRLIKDLLELFGGSVEPIMAHLVEIGGLTLHDVRQLELSLESKGGNKSHTSFDESKTPKLERKRIKKQ